MSEIFFDHNCKSLEAINDLSTMSSFLSDETSNDIESLKVNFDIDLKRRLVSKIFDEYFSFKQVANLELAKQKTPRKLSNILLLWLQLMLLKSNKLKYIT